MLYTAYELSHLAAAPFRAAAKAAADYYDSPLNPAKDSWVSRANNASMRVYEAVTRRYGKPEWQLPSTEINSKTVPVTVETVLERPFGSLARF